MWGNFFNYIKLYKITFSGETAATIQGHDIINPKTESYIFFNENNAPRKPDWATNSKTDQLNFYLSTIDEDQATKLKRYIQENHTPIEEYEFNEEFITIEKVKKKEEQAKYYAKQKEEQDKRDDNQREFNKKQKEQDDIVKGENRLFEEEIRLFKEKMQVKEDAFFKEIIRPWFNDLLNESEQKMFCFEEKEIDTMISAHPMNGSDHTGKKKVYSYIDCNKNDTKVIKFMINLTEIETYDNKIKKLYKYTHESWNKYHDSGYGGFNKNDPEVHLNLENFKQMFNTKEIDKKEEMSGGKKRTTRRRRRTIRKKKKKSRVLK